MSSLKSTNFSSRMKVIVLALCVALVAVAYARPEEKYTNKYDNIDLDEILSSDRLLKNYVNCLMERGPCSPDGAELKKTLPDALKTNCSKCNDNQKNGSKKVIRYLIKNKRPTWNELQAKYDKDGVYIKEHEDELKAAGITL